MYQSDSVIRMVIVERDRAAKVKIHCYFPNEAGAATRCLIHFKLHSHKGAAFLYLVV